MKNNIKVYRAMHNMTQKELAEVLQMTRAAISNIELGKTDPTSAAMLKISHVFNVDARKIFFLPKDELQRPEIPDIRAAE